MQVRDYLQRKDIGYVATFEPKDSLLIKKSMQLMNLGYIDPKQFFKQFDRSYYDKTCDIDPIQVSRSGNKLVNEGLTALAEMMVGARTKTFNIYAIGQGNKTVTPKDDRLDDEVARLNITDNGGTIRQRGSTVYYSLFFPKTIADFDVKETAILDGLIDTDDKMLLRTVLPSGEVIEHDKDIDDIFVGHIIYSGST